MTSGSEWSIPFCRNNKAGIADQVAGILEQAKNRPQEYKEEYIEVDREGARQV